MARFERSPEEQIVEQAAIELLAPEGPEKDAWRKNLSSMWDHMLVSSLEDQASVLRGIANRIPSWSRQVGRRVRKPVKWWHKHKSKR